MTKPEQPKVQYQYTKIKCLEGGKTIHLEWQHQKDGTVEKQSLETQDPPLEGFKRALSNLTAHVQEIMDLPADWMKSVRVLGVSLDWKNGIMGAMITFRKDKLAGEKGTTINTPHYPASPYQEGAPEVNLLPEQCVIDIQELVEQADAYRRGERAQADMFQGEGKPGTGKTKAETEDDAGGLGPAHRARTNGKPKAGGDEIPK